jgi:hypothetical protein
MRKGKSAHPSNLPVELHFKSFPRKIIDLNLLQIDKIPFRAINANFKRY